MASRTMTIQGNGETVTITAGIAFQDAAMRDALKARGFRWSPAAREWEAKRLAEAKAAALVAWLLGEGFAVAGIDGNSVASQLEWVGFAGTAAVTIDARYGARDWDRVAWVGMGGTRYAPTRGAVDGASVDGTVTRIAG